MSHCTWVPSFCFTYALHASHCHIFVLYDVNCLCLFSRLSKLDLKTRCCLENWFQMNTLYHCLLLLLFVAFLAKHELCASIASNLCETLLCLQEGSNASVTIRCQDCKNAKVVACLHKHEGCHMLVETQRL